jgi:regulatory protein
VSSSSIPATDRAAPALPGLSAAGEGGSAAPDELRDCMERAGRLLTTRARSERELGDRLARAGFDDSVVESTLRRLRELGLVDDADFARRWVQERASAKGLGPALLMSELRSKGVDVAVAEAALAEAGRDEVAQATELAASLVRKVARKPLDRQAGSLWQMLRRKGYSSDAAEAAVKAVLPPEGWD